MFRRPVAALLFILIAVSFYLNVSGTLTKPQKGVKHTADKEGKKTTASPSKWKGGPSTAAPDNLRKKPTRLKVKPKPETNNKVRVGDIVQGRLRLDDPVMYDYGLATVLHISHDEAGNEAIAYLGAGGSFYMEPYAWLRKVPPNYINAVKKY